MSRDAGRGGESRGEVPAGEVEGGAEDEVGDFGHRLRADEGEPVVDFGL